MENLEFLYSLFNQYVFQEAKNNIEHLEYYFNSNPATTGNTLVHGLLETIRTHELSQIDEPLFYSLLVRDKKTSQEQAKIMGSIKKWKTYDKKQIEPQREFLREVCADSLMRKASYKSNNNPYSLYKEIKNSVLKIDATDILSSISFKDLDINTMVAEGLGYGYPSSFKWINDLFEPSHQYEAGQMIMITCPPGCMSGDTRIFLADGTIDTLENIYKKQSKNITVYACDGENPKISVAESCQISKYVDSWYVVEIDGKEFRVTENHPFLMIDGTWKRADELKIGDSLMPFNISTGGYSYVYTKKSKNKVITNIKIEKLDTPQPVYDMVNVDIYHNYAVAWDDNSGFFSHNTGKTLWMMTEALYLAINTKEKLHYLAMGDMKPRDFIVRMGAIFSGYSFGDTVKNLPLIFNNMKQYMEDRLDLSVVPAATLSVDEYIEFVLENDYKIVFIDYDSNFLMESSENMYNDFGEVYNKLTKLTQAGVLVFIAAQPKINSWDKPIIELGDVGESSRKIHTVDILFTAGKFKDSPNHLGIFKCCKNRRGEEGTTTGYIRLGNGRFKFIPAELAKSMSGDLEKKDYTDADIDRIVNDYLKTSKIYSTQQTSSKIINPFNA